MEDVRTTCDKCGYDKIPLLFGAVCRCNPPAPKARPQSKAIELNPSHAYGYIWVRGKADFRTLKERQFHVYKTREDARASPEWTKDGRTVRIRCLYPVNYSTLKKMFDEHLYKIVDEAQLGASRAYIALCEEHQ